ncbi:MAG: hypothetical protein WD272_00005, partial [Balneolales bacterium]
ATNTLTIDGGDSSQTILTQNGQSFATLTFDGVEYVTVKNMTIQYTGTYGDAIIFANGANYNQVTNCVSRVNVNTTTSGIYNISFSGSATSNATSADANNNLIANNRIIGGYYAVRAYGSSTILSVGNRIIDNEIDSAYYFGIYSFYGDSTEIIGNSLNMLSRGNYSSYGIYVFYTENFLVKKNNIQAGYMGMYLYNYNTYATANRTNEVSNNMVYTTGNTSGYGYGVYLGYTDEVNIWYNSINHQGSYAGMYIVSNTFSTISNYDIRNNIFASAISTPFETNTSGFMNDFDYNIFYNESGGSIITDPSNSYATLTSYVTANPTFNVNSLQGDPEYAAADDLHIFGILANDQGDGSVAIYEDIDGDTRPSTNGFGVDIGADEFDPPGLDASLSAIYNPSFPFCAGSFLTSAVITNGGMDTLTTVKVYWELNGVLDSTVYNGSILTGDTGIVTLDSMTFTNGVAYDLKIYTADPNNGIDERQVNDTLEYIGLRTALSGVYTVDSTQATSGSNFQSLTELTQALTEYGVCGPTRVNVAANVYNEALFLSDIDGLSSSNYLIIDGGDSSQTILRQSTQYATLTFDGVTNVMVKNMTIEKSSGSGDAVIFAAGARHDTLSNCVTRVPVPSNWANYNITFSATTTSHSTNSGVDYAVIQNNRIIGGYYGIWMYGGTGDLCRYNQILNNELDSAYYYGIYGFYNDS